jgi:hypothetical protein
MKRFGLSIVCPIAWTFTMLCSNTAGAHALPSQSAPGRLSMYTFPSEPQDTFETTKGGEWQAIKYEGVQTVVPNLDKFTASSFVAYSSGFSSGAAVTLTFVTSNTGSDGECLAESVKSVDQMEKMVVDQADGYLYMHGSFGPAGWTPGQCGFVQVTPSVPGGPPIKIWLVGQTPQ